MLAAVSSAEFFGGIITLSLALLAATFSLGRLTQEVRNLSRRVDEDHQRLNEHDSYHRGTADRTNDALRAALELVAESGPPRRRTSD